MSARGLLWPTRKPTVADPVKADPLMSLAFLCAIGASIYGTWYVGETILPRGAGRNPGLGKSGESIETLKGMQDYIVAAVPFFFLLMAVEGVLCWVQSLSCVAGNYESVDTWSSLACGTSQTLMQMLLKPWFPVTVLYCYVFDHYRITNAFATDESWFVGALAFIFGDLCYYWFHRHAHEVHFLWAGHSMHHSGEHYNLSTALRQSYVQALLSGIWSLPMALALPPRTYMLAQQWVTLYQFWIHTCVVRRLPWIIELLFSTPSHHRMHHDRRLHKNFAGVFIVWDRLFGTFHDEFADAMPPADEFRDPLLRGQTVPTPKNGGEEIAYFGIMDPIRSWADSVSQLMIWEKIAGLVQRHGILSLPRHLLVGPGWSTTTARRPLPSVAPEAQLRLRVDVSRIPTAAKLVVPVLYAWTLYAFTIAMINLPKLTSDLGAMTLIMATWSLINQGFIYDRWRYAYYSEIARCVVAVLCHAYMPFDWCAEWHLGVAVVISVLRNAVFA